MKLATIIGLIILATFVISCSPPQEAAGLVETAQPAEPTSIPTQVPDLPDPEQDQEEDAEPEAEPAAPNPQEDADQEAAPEAEPQQPSADQQEAPAEGGGAAGQEIELGDVENPPGTNLLCTQSTGCFFTPLDREDLEILDPEEDYFTPDEIEDTTFERVVCLRGDACYFSNLTEEDIEILDQDIVFTAHADADLIGNWQVTNRKATFQCAGIETDLPASTQTGVIFEVDGDLVGSGLTDDQVELTFTKIWYGTYMSYQSIPSEQGAIDFTYYLALQDDDSFTGFFNSSVRVEDTPVGTVRCEMYRDFDAVRIR